MQPSNYKITVAYDGTNYGGWQIQPNSLTIQQILQEKFRIILRKEILIIGAGRTDAGVHALGQTAHFFYEGEIDLVRFMASANGVLPIDIRLLHIEKKEIDFHAQYDAIAKEYHYHLWLDRIQLPFRRKYSLHVHEKIDIALLQMAAKCFLGSHDFTSFANEAHRGTAAHDPVRNLFRLDVIPQEGGVRLEFQGDGFLYKMVRNIVGFLLEIASGKRKIEEIEKVLKMRDRRAAGKAVSPQGLFLMNVFY